MKGEEKRGKNERGRGERVWRGRAESGREERGKRGRREGTYIITVNTIIAERICSIEYLHNVKIKSCHT